MAQVSPEFVETGRLEHLTPYLKWAGGKRQLAKAIAGRMPKLFFDYYEPFCGSAALFFHLAPKLTVRAVVNNGITRPCFARLNDLNSELMLTHYQLAVRPSQVVDRLRSLEASHRVSTSAFYSIRANPRPDSPDAAAARMIYLNRTCFNGVYRVNKKGEFNTPLGDYPPDHVICDEAKLRACGMALGTSLLSNKLFEAHASTAKRGDFVYFDPPYVPVSKTASFAAFTPGGFGKADHERLAELYRTLAARGVQCLLSNSDTPLVRELYKGFRMHELSRTGSMNSDPTKRGRVSELLIQSAEWETA